MEFVRVKVLRINESSGKDINRTTGKKEKIKSDHGDGRHCMLAIGIHCKGSTNFL